MLRDNQRRTAANEDWHALVRYVYSVGLPWYNNISPQERARYDMMLPGT